MNVTANNGGDSRRAEENAQCQVKNPGVLLNLVNTLRYNFDVAKSFGSNLSN